LTTPITLRPWQDVVILPLEIVGETAKRLSEEFRAHYLEVPWRRIAGLRDVVIHDYMGVARQGLVCSDPESFFQTQN